MKKDPRQQTTPAMAGKSTAVDSGVAQRDEKQNQAAQLSPANVEESPHMNRGDSAGGSGESLSEARDPAKGADSQRPGALDTQYGTKSSMKSGQKAETGRVASAGSGSSTAGEEAQQAPNPGSSEESTGAERDTMTGSRPGSRS
ncbi:MAG: hypothetical protein ACXW2G_06050 [Burkholderiaceae bacterium]